MHRLNKRVAIIPHFIRRTFTHAVYRSLNVTPKFIVRPNIVQKRFYTNDTNTVKLTEDGGVKKQVLTEGSGGIPPKGSKVKVHYVGKQTTGEVFDSSRARNEPFIFTLGAGQVIKGWDLGVAGMKKGEKSILTITAPYAYGSRGAGGVIAPNATLIFEVELLDWK